MRDCVVLGRFFALPAVPEWLVRHLVGDSECSDDDRNWHPYLAVLPMGFTWAFWLAQRANCFMSLRATGFSLSRVVIDGKPLPDLDDDEPFLLPYCDNINVGGGVRDQGQCDS